MIEVKTIAICDECGEGVQPDDTSLILKALQDLGWYATPKILLCPGCLRDNQKPATRVKHVPLRQVDVHNSEGKVVNTYITIGRSYDEAINKVSLHRKNGYLPNVSPDETYEGRAWNYNIIRVI